MGAVEQSNAIFLSITNGQICRKVPAPTKTSKDRVNKNGKTVHEEYCKGWKGRITAITVRDHPEFGKFWNITLTDDQGDAILQMNYSSGYSAAFLKMLPNVDLNADVVVTPSLKKEGDKNKTSLFITQHGVPVKWYYTKDDPKGLPPLKKIKVKGKDQWDDSDIMEFLENMVNTEIIPKIGISSSSAIASDVLEVEAEEIEKDELPF